MYNNGFYGCYYGFEAIILHTSGGLGGGCRVYGSEFRVEGLGFRIFRVYRLGFRGSRVKGVGRPCRVLGVLGFTYLFGGPRSLSRKWRRTLKPLLFLFISV